MAIKKFLWLEIAGILMALLLLGVVSSHPNDKYKGCKVYKLKSRNFMETKKIKRFLRNNPTDIDVWTESRDTYQLMVSEEKAKDVEHFASSENITANVVIVDVKKKIDTELRKNFGLSSPWRWRPKMEFDYGKFNDYRDILVELRRLQCRYKNIMEVVNVGSSYEGRPLLVVKITANILNECSSKKKINWIEAGAHGREWITVAGAMYMIKELLTRQDRAMRDLLQTDVFYIVPVFNPDGYQYTHSTDRLWRKTRSHNWGSNCTGADPNRNWNIKWGEFDSSTDPCSLTYKGQGPESERCVRTYANIMRYVKGRLKSYWSLHSFGQAILIPNSYSETLPSDILRLVPAGLKFLGEVRKTHKRFYGLGSTITVLDTHISGASLDYVHDNLNVSYSFIIEMRPGVILDDEIEFDSGFLAPPEEILPASREVFNGIIGVVQEIESINARVPL